MGTLCERSLRLAAKRLNSLDRGELSQSSRLSRCSLDPSEAECSFAPSINFRSSRRSSRGIHDLSYGDQQRRDERLQRLRAEHTEKESAREDTTFQPKINARTKPSPELLEELRDRQRERELKAS